MLSVPEVISLPLESVGTKVDVSVMILGGRWDTLVIADSIEGFDQGLAIALLDDDLVDRMYERGVDSIGGGRFGFRYRCTARGELATGVRGLRFALKGLMSFHVTFGGREIVVIPPFDGP